MYFTLLTFSGGREHCQRGVNPYNLEGFEPCHVKTDASQFLGNLHDIWKEVLEGSSKKDIEQIFFERCKKQAFFTNFLRIKVFNLLQETLYTKACTDVKTQFPEIAREDAFVNLLLELPKEVHPEATKIHEKERKGLLTKNAS